MKKTLIALVIVILVGIGGMTLVATVLGDKVTTKPQEQVITHPVISTLASQVNVERHKYNLPALVDDPRLDTSAAAKCADMSAKHYHAHNSPEGKTWQSFFVPEYQDKHIGENLSWDYPTSAAVVAGWMGSTDHRENILRPTYAYAGYAVCEDNIVVQHFKGA